MDTLDTRLVGAVDRGRLIDLARRLVALPSINPPGDEAAVARLMAETLDGIGFDVQIRDVAPGRPNVVGTLPGRGGGPRLLLNGHMDVVPPGEGWTREPFGAELVDGRIYGRGSADMKGGLAAMAAAVEAIQSMGIPLRGTVVVTAVVGEERDQVGTRRLVENGLSADFAVIAEPTDLKPVIAHKGDLYYRIVVQGRAAHSSIPSAGVNAIDGMADVIIALRVLASDLGKKHHPLLGAPTLSVGTIEGGIDTCIVPDSCQMTIDRRLLPNETLAEADAELQDVLDRLGGENPLLAATLTRFMTAMPMETPPGSAIERALRRAADEVLGYDPGASGMSGTTDANWLVNVAGIPTVLFGPGSFSQAHRADEFVEVDQLVKAAQVLALTVVDLLR